MQHHVKIVHSAFCSNFEYAFVAFILVTEKCMETGNGAELN